MKAQYLILLMSVCMPSLFGMDGEKKVQKTGQVLQWTIERAERYSDMEKGHEGYSGVLKGGNREVYAWLEYYEGMTRCRGKIVLPQHGPLQESTCSLAEADMGLARGWFVRLQNLYAKQGK